MTPIESSFAAQLREWSNVTALVLTDSIIAGQRDYGKPGPAITFFLASNQPTRTLNEEGGTVRAELEVRCWANTNAAARQVADAVLGDPSAAGTTRLENMNHVYMGNDSQRHWVQNVFVSEEQEEDYPPEHAKKRGNFCVALRVIIWYDR